MNKEAERNIIGGRVAMLRHSMHLDQKDLVKQLNELLGNGKVISVPMLSAWETGRKKIPTKYNKVLAATLCATEEYLLGLTNEKDSTTIDIYEDVKTLYEIKSSDLPLFHGQPIWVEFTTWEYQNNWALYNAINNTLIFFDGIRNITRRKDLRFFTKIPDYERANLKMSKSLEYSQVMRSKSVYVQMLSHDASIQSEYNGWYIHNANRTCLINPWTGQALPYTGINTAFRAYSQGNDSKPLP